MLDINKPQEFTIIINGPGTNIRLTVFSVEDMAIIDSVINRVRKQVGLPAEQISNTPAILSEAPSPKTSEPAESTIQQKVDAIIAPEERVVDETTPIPVSGTNSVSGTGRLLKSIPYSKVPHGKVPWRWRITPENGKCIRDCIVTKNAMGKWQILTMKGNEVKRTTDLKDDATSSALQIRQMISNAKYAKHEVDIWEIKEVSALEI